jgi:hypothetical protein
LGGGKTALNVSLWVEAAPFVLLMCGRGSPLVAHAPLRSGDKEGL